MDVSSKDATPLQKYFLEKAEKTSAFKQKVSKRVDSITSQLEELKEEIEDNIISDDNKEGFLRDEMDGCLKELSRVVRKMDTQFDEVHEEWVKRAQRVDQMKKKQIQEMMVELDKLKSCMDSVFYQDKFTTEYEYKLEKLPLFGKKVDP